MLRLSKESVKDLREGLGSLFLCNVGDYVSGVFLHIFRPVIEKAPIILALLPAASDARGDVYSSYGSRLGTLLHLGLFDKHYRRELETLLVLVIGVNTWIGILVAVLGLLLGHSMPVIDVVFLALASALISAAFMVPATTLLALKSFEKGLDPDNMVAPIATLFGDLVTIPSIVLGYEIETRIPSTAKLVLVSALLLLLAVLIIRIYMLRSRREPGYRRAARIIRENLSVIIASTLLSGLAGAFLLDNMTRLLAWPGILVVVPAFLEDGGAIASRFSSRLATKLHLGSVEPSCSRPSGWVLEQLVVNTIHALMVFTSLGVLGAAAAILSAAPLAWALRVFSAVLLAGLALTMVVSGLTYCLAIGSFRYGLDPDNVLTPLLTSLADILGVMSLVGFTLLVTRL